MTLQWAKTGDALPIQIHSGLTALTRLSQVVLSTPNHAVELEVNWGVMHLLQSLCLVGVLYCNEQLLGLSKMSGLRLLDVAGCEPGNNVTRSALDMLLCEMKAHRPKVDVHLSEGGPCVGRFKVKCMPEVKVFRVFTLLAGRVCAENICYSKQAYEFLCYVYIQCLFCHV